MLDYQRVQDFIAGDGGAQKKKHHPDDSSDHLAQRVLRRSAGAELALSAFERCGGKKLLGGKKKTLETNMGTWKLTWEPDWLVLNPHLVAHLLVI